MCSSNLLERDINDAVASRFRRDGFVVMQGVRIHPEEFDIVLFDPGTRRLANIEIKRRDWVNLFRQARRGQLYCHFSIAVLPSGLGGRIDLSVFRNSGVGLIFYVAANKRIELEYVVSPRMSARINRGFKVSMYRMLQQSQGGVD